MSSFNTSGALTGASAGFMVGGPVGAGIGALAGGLLMKEKKGKFATQIVMTPLGQQLKKSLVSSINKLFPQNLASFFLGDAKKMAQGRQKMMQTTLASSMGPESVGSGQMLRGLMADTQMRMKEGIQGRMNLYGAQRGYETGQLGKKQSYINLESDQPPLLAQKTFLDRERGQSRGADLGAEIGSAAQIIALSRIMGA